MSTVGERYVQGDMVMYRTLPDGPSRSQVFAVEPCASDPTHDQLLIVNKLGEMTWVCQKRCERSW